MSKKVAQYNQDLLTKAIDAYNASKPTPHTVVGQFASPFMGHSAGGNDLAALRRFGSQETLNSLLAGTDSTYNDFGRGYLSVGDYTSIKQIYKKMAKDSSKAEQNASQTLPSSQSSISTSIEKEIQDTLNAILNVTGTGVKSSTESTQAFLNRVDELRKLQVRGMFNSFSGMAARPVQAETPQIRMPTLGGM